MSKIIVTRGLPASGKSTWAKAFVAADPHARFRVSRDEIRAMLGYPGLGDHIQELNVTAIEEAMVTAMLKRNDGDAIVVVDAMHLKATYVKRWYRFGVPVETKDFVVPLEEVLLRDVGRQIAGEHSVGVDVIRKIAQRFNIKADGTLPPVYVPEVAPAERFKPYVPGKVKAYSFDIDGTLLQMNGKRGPYDTSLYHLDDADPSVVTLLWDLQDFAQRLHSLGGEETAFIGLSGRNEDHREATEASLEGWGINLDALYMRPSDNPQGNDADVKSDLVDKYISGVYDVIMHFDDRNRVVDALRAKGMKVAQVQPGDF
jgi:predicted kinase